MGAYMRMSMSLANDSNAGCRKIQRGNRLYHAMESSPINMIHMIIKNNIVGMDMCVADIYVW